MQDSVADQLLGFVVRSKIVAIHHAANSRRGVSDINVAEVISQVAIAQITPQRQPVVEIMGELSGKAGTLNIVIIKTRLTKELAAVVLPVERITTAIGGVVTFQVIEDNACGGVRRRLPGQATHQEAIVVFGVIVFAVAVSDGAGKAVGHCLVSVQRVTHINTGFFCVK